MRWKLLLIPLLCGSLFAPLQSKQHAAPIEKAIASTADSECFFIPPKGWDISDPKTLSPRVKIAFVKNTGKGFCPSINLALEETHVSLSEYLKAVKAIHQQDRSSHWRALGKVRTESGLAQLTEIDSSSEWGPIRILQMILLKEGRAYVVTAASLKEEFSDYYKDIQSAFRSLTLTTDLLSHIPQLERRESLKEKQQTLLLATENALMAATEAANPLDDPSFKEKQWLPFQKAVLSNFEDMGPFWQILLLKNTQQELQRTFLAFADAKKEEAAAKPEEIASEAQAPNEESSPLISSAEEPSKTDGQNSPLEIQSVEILTQEEPVP